MPFFVSSPSGRTEGGGLNDILLSAKTKRYHMETPLPPWILNGCCRYAKAKTSQEIKCPECGERDRIWIEGLAITCPQFSQFFPQFFFRSLPDVPRTHANLPGLKHCKSRVF